jgi:prepilin-type N-terminal cleavage/methylation domain-containing protein
LGRLPRLSGRTCHSEYEGRPGLVDAHQLFLYIRLMRWPILRKGRPHGIRAFTLLEVIVVCAIVATLSAITYPVIRNAVKSAKEANAQSNLHQLYVALAIYRSDEGESGPTRGFPDIQHLAKNPSLLRVDQSLWYSPCGVHPDSPRVFTTLNYYPSQLEDQWVTLASRLGDDVILISDYNCTDPKTPMGSLFLQKKVFFVRANGTLVRKVSRENPADLSFYRP